MFDIENSADYYAMLVADFDDFMEEPQSARRAIHCAITACHLAEWVWHDWLKKCDEVKTKLGITNEKAFFEYLNNHVWLKVLREIANGSKHFKRQTYHTQLVKGYGVGPYGVGPYGRGYLMIDLGATEEVEIDDSLAEIDDPDAEIDEASETRYLAAADLLEVVVRFWRDFFRIYRPDVTVEPSKHHTL